MDEKERLMRIQKQMQKIFGPNFGKRIPRCIPGTKPNDGKKDILGLWISENEGAKFLDL